ncbi:hypothetical protein [Noviluteimonas dokdonensis]|uniref:hypothetical protein n=1 Tax=Noviluteimonas dokdonensis TaxID=414050 RepID=UPI00068BB492|nr:hypothetical protein [Lysobacter dokdonensis]
MVRRIRSFAAAGAVACIATACAGLSIDLSRDVDYNTATDTVAALLSAVAANDQARVDSLTTHFDTPPPSPEALASLASYYGGLATSSTVAGPFLDDPEIAMNDIAGLRRYFDTVGALQQYEWDADAHALSLKFACIASDGPRCVNRLYFVFRDKVGDHPRVNMMIGVRNNPAWAKLWADLPNSHDLAPAAPAPAIEKALAQFAAPLGADVLETSTYTLSVIAHCPEGEVGCSNLTASLSNKQSGKKTSLTGSTYMAKCADRVTPCHLGFYDLKASGVSVRAYPDGQLEIQSPGLGDSSERGAWRN